MHFRYSGGGGEKNRGGGIGEKRKKIGEKGKKQKKREKIGKKGEQCWISWTAENEPVSKMNEKNKAHFDLLVWFLIPHDRCNEQIKQTKKNIENQP